MFVTASAPDVPSGPGAGPVYVISGDGVYVMDGEETPFAAGCVGYAPEGVVHGIKNTGTGPMEVLCIFTPPRG